MDLRRIARFACAVLAVLPPLASGQDERIDKPRVLVGDRWVHRSPGFAVKGVPSDSLEFEVTNVQPDSIQIVITGRPSGVEYDSILTSEQNFVRSGFGALFRPHSGYYSFPLWVGKTYTQYGELTAALLPTQDGAWRPFKITSTVAAWETITVPAGTFRALRIERKHEITQANGTRLHVGERVWYAPEIRNTVRGFHIGPRGEETLAFELVSFSLK